MVYVLGLILYMDTHEAIHVTWIMGNELYSRRTLINYLSWFHPINFYFIGTINPAPCPNGTYTDDYTTGLQKADLCDPCPRSKYCQNGYIAGNCSGGYLCYGGAPVPNPTDKLTQGGETCPFGYYCPPGTPQKQQCPLGKVIAKSGADSVQECVGKL